MKIKKNGLLSIMLLACSILCACNKDWLDAKPNKALVVPTSIADYQALLDNTSTEFNFNQPGLSMVGDGDFFVTDARYAALTQEQQSAYIWAPTSDNFYGVTAGSDWSLTYARILNENVVLDGIQTVNANSSQTTYNNVVGTALFFRSFDFYCLSQEFCVQYSNATAKTDLGLPLRTSANVNLKVDRSSLQQTYDQIIGDLLKAEPLLPVTPLFPTRPSKPAVFGLLARVYLSQQDYNKALFYADSCLQIQNSLMDFNQLSTTAANPIERFNKEVIFSSLLCNYISFATSRLIVDSTLLKSYSSNDLRTDNYFKVASGNTTFKGSYDGTSNLFGGLATDEMYLIRAECNARAGNTTAAMKDLNTLLSTRWKSGTYINLTAANSETALALILRERRKELVYRNLRWSDLRRLNTDTRFQTTLTRTVAGKTYTLLPNSLRYVLPIDPFEIKLDGLQQNAR